MHGDRPAAHAPDALGTQRAGRTDLHREAELTAARWSGPEVLDGLAGRTGRTGGLQVDGEGGLWEAALIRGVRHLCHDRPASVGERLAGLAAPVGAVSHRLVDHAARVRFG